MLHKAWNSKGEMPYFFQGHPSNFKVTRYKTSSILTQVGRFHTIGRSQLSNPSDLSCSRSYVKFQGHTALKIVEFDPNWAFPDCNSSLNSPMAMKCCTKLETAKERCPIVSQGHPSNIKVTRDKTSPILTQIGRFRTIGLWQLSNPSDLPCSRSYIKFQGHTALKIIEFDPNWSFPDCNSSLNSPMAMKCCTKLETAKERCPVQNITDFDPNWAFPDYRPVAAFKSLRFALFTLFPSSYHHEIFRSYHQWQKWCLCKRSRSEVKGQGHRGHNPT